MEVTGLQQDPPKPCPLANWKLTTEGMGSQTHQGGGPLTSSASTRPAESSSTLHHPPNKLLTRAYVRAVCSLVLGWLPLCCCCPFRCPYRFPLPGFHCSAIVLLLDSVYSERIRPIPSHYPVSLHPGSPPAIHTLS